jgi:metal-dependent HD superfamily phosphatase/phosphodiesterase
MFNLKNFLADNLESILEDHYPTQTQPKLTIGLESDQRAITETQAQGITQVVTIDTVASPKVETSTSKTTPGTYIRVPVHQNTKLAAVLERVNQDIELQTMWKCANINAVDRLGMSDHGRVHVQIVANIALKLLRLLAESGLKPGIVENHGLTQADAEVVVVLGALMHDIGICVHRDEHEHHSLWLADRKVRELLDGLYSIEERTIMLSEILHTVVAHARDQRCFTFEAGVVKVADALDMAKGRSRIPFEQGHINIHSLSAAAIESIELTAGQDKPIHIQVKMNNSAGLYQIDELLKKKINNSTLKGYIELAAVIETTAEKKLLEVFKL